MENTWILNKFCPGRPQLNTEKTNHGSYCFGLLWQIVSGYKITKNTELIIDWFMLK